MLTVMIAETINLTRWRCQNVPESGGGGSDVIVSDGGDTAGRAYTTAEAAQGGAIGGADAENARHFGPS